MIPIKMNVNSIKINQIPIVNCSEAWGYIKSDKIGKDYLLTISESSNPNFGWKQDLIQNMIFFVLKE
jgi:hypothetical protein